MHRKTVGVLGLLLALALCGVHATAKDSTCYCVSAPESVSACLGTSVEFVVTASGEGPLTYQWSHGSIPLSDGERISGATSSRLQISDVQNADAGEYSVTVSGSRGMVTSMAAVLSVKAPTVITEHPIDVSVCPGESAGFSVTATGEGTLSYQWYHDSVQLSDGARISGATTPQLTLQSAEAADAGEYTVAVTGECGSVTSTAAMLIVKAPTAIVDDPDDVFACPGTAVGFSVAATGEGALAYQWFHGGAPLSDGGRIGGATSASLQIADVENADAGEYTVAVTGECGQAVSGVAGLTVKAPTAISEHPDDVSVCPGETASFSVDATGEGALAYQWYHDSAPLSDGGRISGATSSRLSIADVEASDAGDYTVDVTGECGAVLSAAGTLSVKAPTVIAVQPESASVYSGDSASFSVTASGEGALSYQWYRGSTPLSDGERVSGATTPELRIVDVVDADAGEYTVTVTGECGEVASSVARLRVSQPMGNLEVVLANQPKDILLILDLSSSMQELVGGETKMNLAKDALEMLIEALPKETQVGLRTFRTCERSDLEVPIQAVSSGQLLKIVRGLETAGKTPLAYTLRQIPGDLEGLKGPHVVVFITDGTETCKEDPVEAARELVTAKLDIIFRLVGFDIARVGGQSAHDKLIAIADAAGGVYVPVETGEELVSAILALVLPPSYRVYDSTGVLVKEGVVGDAPFELPTGTYSITVGADPELLFEGVVVELDETVTITVPSS